MSGWVTIALSDVLVDARPGFACGEDVDDGVFQFRMNNITSAGQLDLSRKRRVPRGSRNIENYFVARGDVLFNATNSPDLVGKTTFFPGLDEPAVFSNHFLRLRPDTDRLDGRFLARWLNLQFERGRFSGMCRQWVNQATVNREALLAMSFPLPSLPEQRRIAAILDKADALRAKRRAALTQLDALTQSIFLDMFGDPATNPKGWPTMPFGQVCETRLGKMLDQKKQTGKHRRLYLRNANVQWFRFDLSNLLEMDFDERDRQELRLKSGDLLICEGGEPGRAAVWRGELEECYFQKALHRARPDRHLANAEYLCWLLWFLAQRSKLSGVTSATIAHLTGEKLAELPTMLPPVLLQQKFANRLVRVQEVRDRHVLAAREMDILFASLQYRAFQGELFRSPVEVDTIYASVNGNPLILCKLDIEKGLEVLIYVASRTKNNDFYKALKTLYVADKHQLEHHGRFIYGETYCALPMGPVPQAAFDGAKVLNGEMMLSPFSDLSLRSALRRTDRQLIPLREPDMEKISSQERESLDYAIRVCEPMSFEKLKKFTHDAAYNKTPANAPIRVEDILSMFHKA